LKRRILLIAALGAAVACAQEGRPERNSERVALLARGEAALAALEPAQALAAFEQAARIAHSADTEMGIVRGYMQGGEYRRALAFAAHAAGAHLDETGGTALYAWLLHAGAQELVARKLLTQALERVPGEPLLAQVAFQLRNPWPTAAGALLRPPARLAPYGETKGLPAGAGVVASATLAGGGSKALVPTSALVRGARYWVRSGLGRLVEARPDPGPSTHGLSLLRLASPLPGPALLATGATSFPGSIAYAVEFAPQADAAPAWPLMRPGFVGAASPDAATRALGVTLPRGSARGGPVFDAGARLIGVAAGSGPAGSDILVPAPLLRQAFGDALFAAAPASAAPPLAPDAIYESALSQTLQLVRSGVARPPLASLRRPAP
jgi:hypothetical protein